MTQKQILSFRFCSGKRSSTQSNRPSKSKVLQLEIPIVHPHQLLALIISRIYRRLDIEMVPRKMHSEFEKPPFARYSMVIFFSLVLLPISSCAICNGNCRLRPSSRMALSVNRTMTTTPRTTKDWQWENVESDAIIVSQAIKSIILSTQHALNHMQYAHAHRARCDVK